MPATMSIRGLYIADNTLFSEMSVASEMTNDDKETIIANILNEFAELEVIYPDPVFMKHAIGAWSWKEVPTWDRIYAASLAEYNPIENYNRTETSTETGTSSHNEQNNGSETHSGTDTETHSGTDREVHTGTDRSIDNNTTHVFGTDTDTNSGTDTVTRAQYAYDSNTAVNTGSDTTQHGHVLTKAVNDTTTVNGSSAVTHGETIDNQHGQSIANKYGHAVSQNGSSSGSGTNKVVRQSNISGNIGVTTSQQMLEQELLVAPKLNVYNYIMESFKKRFCIEVWS